MPRSDSLDSAAAATIVSLSIGQLVTLAGLRAAVLEFGVTDLLSPGRLRVLALVSLYDTLPVVLGAVAFLVLLFLFRSRRTLVVVACWLWSVGIVGLGLVNLEFYRIAGGPLDYRWLYYADFFSDLTERQALLSAFDLRVGLTTLACGAAFFLSLRSSRALLAWLAARDVPLPLILCGLLVLYLGYAGHSARRAGHTGIPHRQMANPLVSIVLTAVGDGRPDLYDMTPRFPPDHPAGASSPDPPRPPIRGREGQPPNVLVIVLESVSVEFLEPFGGSYPVTPALSRFRPSSFSFTSVYSHAPSTNKAVVSLLGSIYPWLSYHALTRERPAVRLPSLSGVFKAEGYRTAFFSSADLSFQDMVGFLRHRDFDVIQDYRGRGSGEPEALSPNRDWRYLDASFDATTVASLLDWTARETHRPFFAILWTAATHYPYFVSGPGEDHGVADEYLSRYLDALGETDAAVGGLLDGLSERGLLPDTLTVVLGDHGESFGRHGHYGHASSIHEENIRVPVMLIHEVFDGGSSDAIAGLIDVAPTILSLLGHPAPPQWQGRSLFDTSRVPRAYFFSPWMEPQFGFREGRFKYIFNATENSYEMYDVVNDRWESRNIFESHPEAKELVDHRLAAWLGYQRDLTRSLLAQPP